MSIIVWFGIIIAFLTVCALFAPHGGNRTAPLLAAQPAHQGAGINYSGNPYRIGAYVYVMEDSAPSEHDWQGTFLGMSNGMAMVRDRDSLVVAHVGKDQLYGAAR